MNDFKHTFFFCIGCQKTGTTLLARILDQHPDIACIWESYALYQDSPDCIFNPLSDKRRTHGFNEKDVKRWSKVWRSYSRNFVLRTLRKVSGYDYVRVHNFRSSMKPLMRDFAYRCNARAVGDKWPWYIDYLHIICDAFPEAKYIYNVRDPRGLWNSAQKFKSRERGDEILNEMLQKDKLVSPYLHRDNFLCLRYEDLLENTEVTCKRLYEFLGCDFKISYLDYDQEADSYPERWRWISQASDQLEVNHANKWRDQMSRSQIEAVNKTAGAFLEKYNYPL